MQRLENIMYCKIPLKEKYLNKIYLGRNLHIKAELLVIVSSGESGMGQGGTLSWRRGSLCPGWLQECPSVTILHASGPPAPQSLPPPRVSLAMMQSWTLDPRGKPCSALAPTVALSILEDTQSCLLTYRKKSNQVLPPAPLPGVKV